MINKTNRTASSAGHTLANTLVPLLPPTQRIVLIDASSYSYYPVAALRGAVVPGWEDKITVPLTTETVFGKSSPHQVVAPNKVVELKEGSLVLEKEFEGSTELPFFVRLNSTYDPHRSADNRNAYLLLVPLNHTLCEGMLLTRLRRLGPSSSQCREMLPRLRRWSLSVLDQSDLSMLVYVTTPL